MKKWKELFKYCYTPLSTHIPKEERENWFKAQELLRTNEKFKRDFENYSKRNTIGGKNANV